MKLYLVRHGETQLNVDKVYYGWTDCMLNQKGVAQAEQLKTYFDTISYDKIISSDLCRSITTSDIINRDKQKEVVLDKNLREFHFGLWEGKSFSFVKEQYPDEYKKWSDDWQNFMMPEGETYVEFYHRVEEGLKKMINEEKDSSNILVVSHNGVMSVMLCILTGAGKSAFWKFFAEQGTFSLISVHHGDVVIEKINCPVII